MLSHHNSHHAGYITPPLYINPHVYQSGTYCKEEGSSFTALSNTSCVLKWSGTSSSCHGSTSAALIHIYCVLKRSRIRKYAAGLSHIALLHISWLLKWSGTCRRVYGSLRTASLHISSVLKRSGTLPMSVDPCALLRHTSPGSKGALRSLLSSVEHFHKTYLFYTLRPRKGPNFMDRKNDAMRRPLWSGHLSIKEPMKSESKNHDSVIEAILWIDHLSMYKQ